MLFFYTAFTAGDHQLAAQDINENNLTCYTRQQGLSNNFVSSIAQDSAGFIWAASAAGLNRFNGSNFLQFHSTIDSNSLPQEILDGLVWLDKQKLAVYSLGGVHIINTSTGETHNLLIPYSDKQYQYKFNSVSAVSGYPNGDIFITTRSGFYHFDKDYHLLFRFDYMNPAEVNTIHFSFGRRLLWLDDHRLIIITYFGIYYYEVRGRQFRKMQPADCPVMAKFIDAPKNNYQFYQQKPGYLFVISPNSDSLVYLNIAANKQSVACLPFKKMEFDYRSFLTVINDTTLYLTGNISGYYKLKLYPGSGKINFESQKYLSSYYCHDILQDRDHNLWIATNKGLLKQDNSKLPFQQAAIPSALQDLFPNISIADICTAGDRLYVTTRWSNELLIFDKEPLRFVKQISLNMPSRSASGIFSVVKANDSTLFIGSNGPLYSLSLKTDKITEILLDKTDREHIWIADMFKDSKGTIWTAVDSVYKYDAVTKHFSILKSNQGYIDRIIKPDIMKEDASGNLWISGHGLIRYNFASNSFDRLVDSFPFKKIPDKQVTAFTIDRQNNLWININNNGLICYDINKKTFRHFTRDDGLPDDNNTAMIAVGNKLWVAGFSGIACVDLQTYRISSFGKEDGFPDQPVEKRAKFFYDSAFNKLYVGFTNILMQFDPRVILQRGQPPKLFIESVVTGDQKKMLFPTGKISASWKNNEITVTIGSINFFTSNSQRFAYRLVKNDDTPWQQLGTQNTFSISSLSPGYHRIQVKLFSLSNRWPQQVKEIGITIFPPVWKRTWFMVMSFVLIILVAYFLFKWRTGNIRKKEQAKTHIQKLKAEDYKNQFELEQISHYFSSSLAGKTGVDEVLWDVAKNLIGRMDYEDCMIYTWNDDRTRMIQKAAYGPKGDPVAISSKHFDVGPGQGIVGHVMQTREPLLIQDTRLDQRYRVDDIERQSELCVPVIHNNELIGIIDSEHHDANHFQERDIKILTTIATLLGNKIKQIESEQSLEIKKKEIAVINLQLAEAQLSALQTQMNPHFIFNSLNSIKGMILANEQTKASRYLSKFAQMIRMTLNQSKEIFTTLYENEEHLDSYLAMEKLRFDDSFTFSIDVDDNIDKEEILIPTLMIQPLAENAIWHGLMPMQGPKRLTISFARFDETVSCTIEDNGIGIKRAEELKHLLRPTHRSVGLNNLRNRIEIMNEKYDSGCTLEITDLSDLSINLTGTRSVLRFNLFVNKPELRTVDPG